MTIDPLVHIQPMVSIHRSKIGYPAHFSTWRKARKYSSIIGHAKYDGLKGLCQKICCSKTVKMKKAEVYSSINCANCSLLTLVDGLKGLCQKICCSKTVKMQKAEVYSSINCANSSLLTLVEEGSPLLRSDSRPATCCPPPLVGMGDATDLQHGQPATPHATPPPPPLGLQASEPGRLGASWPTLPLASSPR